MMRRHRTALMVRMVCVTASLLATAESPIEPAFDTVWKEGRTLYRSLLQEHGMLGSSLLVMHDGRVVGAEYVGTANVENNWPVDEQTIYHWASNTKTLTGIAIMQLRDRGLLSLDDPVVKYIPELREVHNPFGPMEAITIKHLLTHSAGFRASTWPWGGDQPWHPHEPLHWSQLVAMFPYTEILFPPGSKYSYSNPAIIFLGRIIELLTTDDYEVYIDKNIFKPLEMHRSYFDDTPYHLKRHKAQSYLRTGSQITPERPETNTGITVSNGGWNAPLGDVAKYLDFLMGNSTRRDVYEGVLNRSSLEEMFQPRLDTGKDEHIGLTFFIENRNGRTLIGHSGGQNGFVTRWQMDLSSRTAYMMAFNTLTVTKPNEPVGTVTVMTTMRRFLTDKVFPVFEGNPSSVERR